MFAVRRFGASDSAAAVAQHEIKNRSQSRPHPLSCPVGPSEQLEGRTEQILRGRRYLVYVWGGSIIDFPAH